MFGAATGVMQGMAGGGGSGMSGGQNETSSGQDNQQDLMNSSGINFGNYYGGQTLAGGSMTTASSPWPWVAGAVVVALLLARGRK